MAPRGERVLVVSFGPAATPVLATALAFARQHASSVEPGGPGGYRTAFALDRDAQTYGRAEQLIRMTFSWRATHADGGVEAGRVVADALFAQARFDEGEQVLQALPRERILPEGREPRRRGQPGPFRVSKMNRKGTGKDPCDRFHRSTSREGGTA